MGVSTAAIAGIEIAKTSNKMPPKELELWLKGEKIPVPVLDMLLKRPILLKRPYRSIVLTTIKRDLVARRTPEAIIGNLFMNIVGNVIPSAKIAAQNVTKEAINKRFGISRGEG